MSSLGIRGVFEPLRSIDSATFTGAYLPVSGPLEHPCYLIKFVNGSGVDVLISTDGTTDMAIVPAGGFCLYDDGANASREAGVSTPKGTQFYASAAASTGLLYIEAKYIER